MTVAELIFLKEKEHKIEFKEAKGGSFSYNGKRRSILGYVVAFANEGGGKLVFGVADKYPHTIVGTNQNVKCYKNQITDKFRLIEKYFINLHSLKFN